MMVSNLSPFYNAWLPTRSFQSKRGGLRIRSACELSNPILNRYHAKPKIPIHKNENLSIAFRFMTDTEKIPLVNIGKHFSGSFDVREVCCDKAI